MKAIFQDRYGPPDVLEWRDVPAPVAGPGDLLVRVHAAGVDRGVWHLMTGLPYLVRLMGYGFKRPRIPVPGMEVAGHVEAVGDGVVGVGPGDEVFGIGEGTFAELALIRGGKFARKPAGLGFEQAAALPVSGMTALQAVRDDGAVEVGQRVLVIGASGGVGSYAVQIAKALGAAVTGVSSRSKADLVRSLGADHVIDYAKEEIDEGGRTFDVVLDMAGNRPLRRLRRALAPKGTLVIVGGEQGGRWIGGIDRQLRAALLSPLVGQTLRAKFPTERGEDLEALARLVEEGSVTPVLDRTFPMEQAPEAIRYLTAGHARGKVVVTI